MKRSNKKKNKKLNKINNFHSSINTHNQYMYIHTPIDKIIAFRKCV